MPGTARRIGLCRIVAACCLALHGAAAAQVWEVDDLLLAPASSDDFGYWGLAMATGDFDGDGIGDLAIGWPGADNELPQAGSVQVLLGGGGAFSVAVPQIFFSNSSGAHIGSALAAGDFDGSQRDQLAIGAPGAFDGVGNICVIKIFPGGFIECFNQIDIPAPAGGAGASGDLFGAAFAVGDFDGDGFDDLAIGAPGRTQAAPAADDAGRVYVLLGSSDGLRLDETADGFFAADAQAEARFGRALAAGDFDGDDFDDLAVGEPGRTLNGQTGAGRVVVVHGSAAGLDLADPQSLSNASFGITHEAGDEFGAVLAAGDFDRSDFISCAVDGCADDLAIGSPNEDVGSATDAGIVVVTYGVVDGELSTTFFQLLDQSDLGYDVEAGDRFGAALAVGQLDSTGLLDTLRRGDDLAIGSPGEQTALGLSNQGVVHLLSAYATEGLDAGANQIVELRSGLAAAPAGTGDELGAAIVIADFDGDGPGDLAIGIPGRDEPGVPDAGVVQVLFGALFADGFERGNEDGWSATAP